MSSTKPRKNIKLKKIVDSSKSSFKKVPLLKLIYITIAINLVTCLLVLIFQGNLPPEVPLFYGLAEGEEQVVPSLWLLIPTASSALLLLLNTLLALLLKDDFLQKTLILTSFALAVLSLTTSIKIVFLVGSF